MRRISREEMLMEMAMIVALRGTCSRLSVGCLIVFDNRPISMGYNGAPKGVEHCKHNTNHDYNDRDTPCTVAVHAEANAIVFAARKGIAVAGATLYTTHSPCLGCSNLIINSGIMRVVYKQTFRNTDGLEYLKEAGVIVRGFNATT